MKFETLETSQDQTTADNYRKRAYINLCELLDRDPDRDFPLIRAFIDNTISCAMYECSIGMTKSWNEAVRKQ